MTAPARAGKLVDGETVEGGQAKSVIVRRTGADSPTVIAAPFAREGESFRRFRLVGTAGRDEVAASAMSWPTEATIEARRIRVGA